jgi:hypothetical protein
MRRYFPPLVEQPVAIWGLSVSAYAQDSSLPEFNLFQIQTGSVVLEGAALSPDGEQLAAAYFGQASASSMDDALATLCATALLL